MFHERLAKPVDIVVPVFNAFERTRCCLESILRYRTSLSRIVVVDDSSTDKALVDFLSDFSQKNNHVELIRTERNLGFVRAANLGLQHSTTSDVLLLNSDTILTAESIQRLQQCAYNEQATGLVSPLSNNATICSVPTMAEDNPVPEDYEAFTEKLRLLHAPRYPQLPTAVGFCLYIKRRVLKELGYFDEIFGRGYCEENDLCQRAKQAGYKIRLCDDVYIPHFGQASFGDGRQKLLETNQQILFQRYPCFRREIDSFIRTNPLWDIQARAKFLLEKPKPAAEVPAYLTELASQRLKRFPMACSFDQRSGGLKSYFGLLCYRLGVRLIDKRNFGDNVRDGNVSQDVIEQSQVNDELQLISGGEDPFVTLRSLNIPTKNVHAVRIRMRADSASVGYAQLYFAHSEQENFSEEKSISIPLPEHGTYTELWLDLRHWEGLPRWQAGETISKLRFDPLMSPGKVWLRDISFGRYLRA